MRPANKLRNIFQRTLRHAKKASAGLSLAFLAVATPASAADTPPVPPQTAASIQLEAMMAEANAKQPGKIIVLLDHDKFFTALTREADLTRFMISDQLGRYGIVTSTPEQILAALNAAAEQGLDRDDNVIEKIKPTAENPRPTLTIDDMNNIRDSIGGKEHFDPSNTSPGGIYITTVTPNVCVIVPQTPDLASLSFSQRYVGLFSPLRVTQDFEPYAQLRRVTYHEIWHCYDRVYVPEFKAKENIREKNPKLFAWHQHKAEVFAEVAALLTEASHGRTDIIRQQGDLRMLSSEYNTDYYIKNYNKRVDPEYYQPATYHLTPAVDAVQKLVEEQGSDKIKAMTWQDIENAAVAISESTALTKEQFSGLMEYYADRKGYLQKIARSTTPADRDMKTFMDDYKKRLDIARARMIVPGAKPDDPFPVGRDDVFSDQYYWANSITADFKDSMVAEIRSRFEKTPPGPYRREQVLIDFLNDHRVKLQHANDPAVIADLEGKLLFMRAYVSLGEFRSFANDFEAQDALKTNMAADPSSAAPPSAPASAASGPKPS